MQCLIVSPHHDHNLIGGPNLITQREETAAERIRAAVGWNDYGNPLKLA
jgi:hypothetical protein